MPSEWNSIDLTSIYIIWPASSWIITRTPHYKLGKEYSRLAINNALTPWKLRDKKFIGFRVSCKEEITPTSRTTWLALHPQNQALLTDHGQHRQNPLLGRAAQRIAVFYNINRNHNSRWKEWALSLWQALPGDRGFHIQFSFQARLFPITQPCLDSWTSLYSAFFKLSDIC